MQRLTAPPSGPSTRHPRNQTTARKLAFLLGVCLPFSGGLSPSAWLPDYPDQLTVIRLVTMAVLAWLFTHPLGSPVPRAPRRMLQAFALATAYATASVFWTPDAGSGLNDLLGVVLALATAVAAILLVRGDRPALRSLALGILTSGGLQVGLAVGEVGTGRHLSSFSASYLERWNLANIEQVLGATAWGSLGNPNDLGGFWLLTTAVFLSMGAYGIALRRSVLIMAWGILLLSAGIGLNYLVDARAYRLGLALIFAMIAFERILPPTRLTLRIPFMILLACAAIAAVGYLGLSSFAASVRESDVLRLSLISDGLASAVVTGGFGRGIGAERALIDSGQIPLNFHNVVIQLAAELGLIVAAAFLFYLLALVVGWAFVTRSSRAIGRKPAFARAALAVSLLVYGATSSGVLQSPLYWAFFALTALLAGVHQSAGEGHATSAIREKVESSARGHIRVLARYQ